MSERKRFPFITVGATLCVLFVFLFLMWFVAARGSLLESPKPDAKAEQKVDAAAKLDELNARNENALKGVGAKMSHNEARAKLLGQLKSPNDKLPFPTPEK